MILALDTSSEMLGLALHDGRRLLWESSWPVRLRHTVELAPAVKGLLDRTGIRVRDLEAVALTLGPGSFTALRIGISFAKGLALASAMKLVGVPTLDVLARAQIPSEEPLVAVLETGRRGVAAAVYQCSDEGWRESKPPKIYTWPGLVEAIPRRSRVCGEIGEEGRSLLEHRRDLRVVPGAWSLRRAGHLAEVAWEKLRAGETTPAGDLAPLYLNIAGA
ncbi:MAG: tRNA (adenosine(37)-N6)-threonylcarbamoyltransferase complex dimerization subunit type 1 TsaB [Anaerolineales bacterium]|jgi:tRNA threonylcarbamoyladenosine biosynthesis protein TsaB